MNIELRMITRDTVRDICALDVREDQKAYVAANAISIAQAHFEPTAVLRAIHSGDVPVGFVQWRRGDSATTAVLWRLMIAEAHQAMGYGRLALGLVLEEMRSSGFERVETSVVLGPSSPIGFYLSAGFAEANRTTPQGEWLLWRHP